MFFSTLTLDEQGGGEPPPFGQQLKALREARGLSIEEVARATNTKAETIETIEAGTILEHTPPTYARGFVRLYAEHLEADLDRIMEDFDRCCPAESARLYVKSVGTMMHKDFRPGIHRRSSPVRIFSLILLALFVCVCAAYIYVHFNNWFGISEKTRPPRPPGDLPSLRAPETPLTGEETTDTFFVLRVYAEENTAIKAEVDGTLVDNEVLGKGKTKEWKGKRSVRLELADPSGVRISRDGEPIADDLGTEPVTITLDENGLRVSPLEEE